MLGELSSYIEDAFRFQSPQTFETAIISTGQVKLLPDNTIDFWQKREHLLATVTASQAFGLTSETVTEEGLTFTRVSVRLVEAAREGFVRVEFKPAKP